MLSVVQTDESLKVQDQDCVGDVEILSSQIMQSCQWWDGFF